MAVAFNLIRLPRPGKKEISEKKQRKEWIATETEPDIPRFLGNPTHVNDTETEFFSFWALYLGRASDCLCFHPRFLLKLLAVPPSGWVFG
jgi:hypothetical protein